MPIDPQKYADKLNELKAAFHAEDIETSLDLLEKLGLFLREQYYTEVFVPQKIAEDASYEPVVFKDSKDQLPSNIAMIFDQLAQSYMIEHDEVYERSTFRFEESSFFKALNFSLENAAFFYGLEKPFYQVLSDYRGTFSKYLLTTELDEFKKNLEGGFCVIRELDRMDKKAKEEKKVEKEPEKPSDETLGMTILKDIVEKVVEKHDAGNREKAYRIIFEKMNGMRKKMSFPEGFLEKLKFFLQEISDALNQIKIFNELSPVPRKFEEDVPSKVKKDDIQQQRETLQLCRSHKAIKFFNLLFEMGTFLRKTFKTEDWSGVADILLQCKTLGDLTFDFTLDINVAEILDATSSIFQEVILPSIRERTNHNEFISVPARHLTSCMPTEALVICREIPGERECFFAKDIESNDNPLFEDALRFWTTHQLLTLTFSKLETARRSFQPVEILDTLYRLGSLDSMCQSTTDRSELFSPISLSSDSLPSQVILNLSALKKEANDLIKRHTDSLPLYLSYSYTVEDEQNMVDFATLSLVMTEAYRDQLFVIEFLSHILTTLDYFALSDDHSMEEKSGVNIMEYVHLLLVYKKLLAERDDARKYEVTFKIISLENELNQLKNALEKQQKQAEKLRKSKSKGLRKIKRQSSIEKEINAKAIEISRKEKEIQNKSDLLKKMTHFHDDLSQQMPPKTVEDMFELIRQINREFPDCPVSPEFCRYTKKLLAQGSSDEKKKDSGSKMTSASVSSNSTILGTECKKRKKGDDGKRMAESFHTRRFF